MIKTAIGLVFGGICCLGLSIAPIPFQKWVIARQVSGFGAITFFSVGYIKSERNKEEQKTKDLWCFQQQQKQKKLEEAIEPVLAKELVDKQNIRAKYSVADAEEEMKENFTVLQVERYGEDWLRSQMPVQPKIIPETIPENIPEVVPEKVDKVITFTERQKKLLKLIAGHEGGWIGQTLQKPLLLWGDMGSYKSYFAAFLALCRHYLRGHQIISIADPHFHQNKEESWKCLVALGVSGYGANHNYFAVGEQLNVMYSRFATRTLKDKPLTSIWDEVTGYGSEEGTIVPAKKLIRKIVSDPRKANEAPILIGHDNTLAALGAGEGFSKSRDRGIIQLELYSDSENRPLFKGTISGIKTADGEFIDAQKVSIAAEWIRPEWVYALFNDSNDKQIVESLNEAMIDVTCGSTTLTNHNANHSAEAVSERSRSVAVTSTTIEEKEVKKVIAEAPEVRDSNASAVTSILPEKVRSKALAKILALLLEAGIASDEVILLIPTQPDRAVWLGVKLLGKTMTATIRDIFGMGVGGAKFKLAKIWYDSLKKEFN
jgi:hypothetical protein